jgi:osmotically-inducible protein OsmY
VAEPRYEQERIRQALATDPRVGEPELSVEIVAGRVLVSGSVPSRAVRDAVDVVVIEVAPGMPLDNRVEVARRDAPAGEEPIG